ncbi:MAG TPA: PTS beta-glucoside transporter subunit EIIBCA, partial [Clostridium sp.]|nr:PTS beta-glucoside transporter subunit EIIBCA [Clostridium sp.]
RPFVAVMIGGGLGGLFAGITGVKAYSIAWGLFGLPAYIGAGDFKNLWLMVSAVIISFVGAAIVSYILGVPSEDDSAEKESPGEITGENPNFRTISLSTAAEGQLVQLTEVKDQAFSTGALGKGVGIIPKKDTIYAPVDGEVAAVFPTKHAIGIKGDQGEEVLIHIGIDTVKLDGKHFEVMVQQGDVVKRGQKLAIVDFESIVDDGYDTTVIVIITNTNDYLDVIPEGSKQVHIDDPIMNIVLEQEQSK